MTRRIHLAVLFVVSGLTSGIAEAHEGHDTNAKVVWNEQAETLEVTLKISGLELENVVSRKTEKRVDVERTPDARDRVANYLKSHFVVSDADKRPLKQTLIGWEIEALPSPLLFRCAGRGEGTFESATEERSTLMIGSKERLTMKIAVFRPKRASKLPVIVSEAHRVGWLPAIEMFLDKGYLFVQYQHEDLDPDAPKTVGPAQQAYPEYDWATLAVWAWGAMRVVDYLESRDDVDLGRIAITGHSRGGKAALLAGALDQRFALVAPNGSGCGGAGCFRDTGADAESLAKITDPARFAYWFHPRLRQFADREDWLPFDQHFVKALVAPRALLCTEARGDAWANPNGTRRTSAAAGKVFDLLNASDENGLHFRDGRHDQTNEDWLALLEFAQWHFFGERPENASGFRVEID